MVFPVPLHNFVWESIYFVLDRKGIRSNQIATFRNDTMNFPECAELKAAYDKCFEEKIAVNLKAFVWDPVAAQSCNEPFEDVKACYEEMMRRKIAEKRQK